MADMNKSECKKKDNATWIEGDEVKDHCRVYE